MSNDLNNCQFIGRCGKDPEVRYMANGDAVCNISIAVGKSWKDKTSGEKKEQTEWVRVSFFGKLAEIAGQYIKKGKQVYVQGRMETREYTDKDGVKKYSTEIRGENMQLLGGGDDAPAAKPAVARPAAKPAPQSGASSADAFGDMDDDIPFATSSASFDMESKLDRRIRSLMGW
jgi:single-strand DNA-binding protein